MAATPTNREIILFVCDSLMQGEELHTRLAAARPLGPATTAAAYDLVDLGTTGALVPGGRVSVSGELYALEPQALATLDVFRGHPVLNQRIPIQLADGREAQSYAVAPDQSAGRRRILSGDWRKRRGATSLGGSRGAGPVVRWSGRR
ncbi:gamma-glutamylcyclotransferase family protein [Polyangium sp. y55x31]|uniref:gamma-glutamylcyclotransferase family protein n=1 Tax=Polyangium sp. y55x31 TaxID=3042688 RepID=UPI002482F1BD|nr:gamma-glutamylcyclotransferase family protein [Polyangium sp. y55x31]MDI1475685.1 gamma-glutamylcyclotransferase [Polyangium sp. y55x31]